MDAWEVIKVLLAIVACVLIVGGVFVLMARNLPGLKFRRPQFSLQTLLLAFVVVWSSMATFGPGGLVLAAILLGIVAFVRSSESMLHALAWVAFFIFFALCLLGLLLPAVNVAREAARRATCCNNIKQVALALHNYHDSYGCFPPAYVPGPDGKPWHSWRVLILPYLEQDALYKAYDFNEPWNGPNNSKLANTRPLVYACPADLHASASGATSYVAVVGAKAAFTGAKGRRLKEFAGRVHTMIMLVEVTDSGINWMEPRDLCVDEAGGDAGSAGVKGISSYHAYPERFFYHAAPGPTGNVACADGSVHFLYGEPSEMEAVVNIDGSPQKVPFGCQDGGPEPNWTRIIGLAVLTLSVLVLLLRPREKPQMTQMDADAIAGG